MDFDSSLDNLEVLFNSTYNDIKASIKKFEYDIRKNKSNPATATRKQLRTLNQQRENSDLSLQSFELCYDDEPMSNVATKRIAALKVTLTKMSTKISELEDRMKKLKEKNAKVEIAHKDQKTIHVNQLGQQQAIELGDKLMGTNKERVDGV